MCNVYGILYKSISTVNHVIGTLNYSINTWRFIHKHSSHVPKTVIALLNLTGVSKNSSKNHLAGKNQWFSTWFSEKLPQTPCWGFWSCTNPSIQGRLISKNGTVLNVQWNQLPTDKIFQIFLRVIDDDVVRWYRFMLNFYLKLWELKAVVIFRR